MVQRIVPEPTADDDDDIVVALETARVSEERRDLESAVRWLQRAVSAARRQGRPDRAGVLSRCILKLGGREPTFEKSESAPQVLKEIADDDFTEQTIVEATFDLKAPDLAPQLGEAGSDEASGPPTSRTSPSFHYATRVAVRKMAKGGFEVRPLSDAGKLQIGEQEALLVPTSANIKF